MSVRTAQLVKGMKTAAGAVKDFGGKAAASVGTFGGLMASAGRATAGVVKDFYIAPLARAGRAIGEIGKEVGKSLAFAGKGLAGPLAAGGGIFAGMAKGAAGLGRSLAGAGLKGLTAGLKAATFAGGAFASTFRGVQQVAGKLAIVGGVAAAGFYKIAKSASNLFEQNSRAGIMFGDSADYVRKEVDAMAGAFGIARAESLATTSAMAGMFQGIGYGQKESAQLSVHFLKLATDLSSIANIPVAEALEKIQSGIAGEVRPLREVGVFLSEVAIKEKAAALGIAKLGTELTEAQKVQARVALITEKLGYANGDLAHTANNAENATRGFLGRLQNLAETVGTALLPIVGSAMTQLQTGVEVLSLLWSGWTRSVVADASPVVGAVGVTTESVGYLQRGIVYVADAWQTVKGVFGVVQSYITSGLAKIVTVIGYMASALDAVADKLHLTKTGLGDVLKTYGEDLKRLSDQQFVSAGKALTAPSAAGSVGDLFAEAQSRIKAMRTEATRPGVDVSKIAPAAGPTKVKEQKFASASVSGSQDATNAILRSRFGGGEAKKPEVKAATDTARNTAETVALLRRMVGGSREPIEIKGLTSAQMAGSGFLGEYF